MITTGQADLTAALRDAVRSSDPRMSKYNPLPRILTFDDFNHGAHGWVELGGNYNGRGDLDSMDELLPVGTGEDEAEGVEERTPALA